MIDRRHAQQTGLGGEAVALYDEWECYGDRDLREYARRQGISEAATLDRTTLIRRLRARGSAPAIT